MSVLWVVIIILLLSAAGFVLGKRRAIASAGGNTRDLHSLPNYYGWYVAVLTFIPAVLVLSLWLIIQPMVIERQLSKLFTDSQTISEAQKTLVLADVRRLAAGLDSAVQQGVLTSTDVDQMRTDAGGVRDKLASAGVALGAEVTPQVLIAAQSYRSMTAAGALARALIAIAIAIAGFVYALRLTNKDFRARNRVETVV